ncbi:unnamed protein product [Nippostrongylus brasiliensis]|uniref:RRP15-like protein n=1 Tax=Nippostrongylus brasiliensis TaxID=27835 RepID=A0A0N4Y3X9_NIPBR|nr:unnamed protein product [Nippostrongylus brasiliensis]
MKLRQESSVITLSDTDCNESQDLFESPQKGSDELNQSYDLFSSPEIIIEDQRKEGRSGKGSVQKSGRRSNGSPRCSSSVIVSPRRNLTPSVRWKCKVRHHHIHSRGNRSHRAPLRQMPLRDGGEVPVVKSDNWASDRLSKIARKFEERNKIMATLVQNDKDFLEVMRGGALDRVQKEAKEKLVKGAVVRKKADRERMTGVTCAESKDYFDALELSPESKKRRIDEVGFPTDSEQRRRGLIRVASRKSGRNLFKYDSSDHV